MRHAIRSSLDPLPQELAAGVAVEAKQVERTAEALGTEIAAEERQKLEPRDQLPLPVTLYLGIDGTGIPLRADELTGRTGKPADGSAKTREVKLCTVWSVEGRDEHGTPVRDEGSVTYTPKPIATACVTPTFKRKACALPPASSKPVARWPSLPDSNAPACIGPYADPTTSSRCAAANPAAAFRISGNEGRPHDGLTVYVFFL